MFPKNCNGNMNEKRIGSLRVTHHMKARNRMIIAVMHSQMTATCFLGIRSCSSIPKTMSFAESLSHSRSSNSISERTRIASLDSGTVTDSPPSQRVAVSVCIFSPPNARGITLHDNGGFLRLDHVAAASGAGVSAIPFAIQPPPRTRLSSYNTTACPGATPNCGSWNSTRRRSPSSSVTSAFAAVCW